MPSLSDKSSRPSQNPSSPIPFDQGPIQEGRSSGHRPKKKHDRGVEIASRDKVSTSFPKELTSPPSLLSQLQASSPPLPYASDDISSPFLATLGTFPTTDDTNQAIDIKGDWTKNISSDSSPPNDKPNGFSLAGSSPPVYQPTKGYSGGFSNTSPAPSPPTTHAKLSRRTSGYQSLGGYLSSSPGRERPISGHSQRSPSQNPLLPHYPQPHFYGAPQVDFDVPQTHRESQGSTNRGCRVLGNLASAGGEGFGGAESVLLIGLQDGLEVFSFDNGRADRIGRLGDLRGTVMGAQLLPSSLRDDAIHSLRPLVALVLHGPQHNERAGLRQSFRNQSDDALFDPSASTIAALKHTEDDDTDHRTLYQTTVEVYSLAKCEHIATLLKSAPAESPFGSQDAPRSTDAPPDGDWVLQACGRFLIVGSGRSGEVYIFEIQYNNKESSLFFKCIGKTWTSIAQPIPRSRSTSSAESNKPVLEDGIEDRIHRREGPIFALSHRWLATVPPVKPTKTTVHASIDLQQPHHKPPGLSSHTSPQTPHPSCDLDTPGQESLLNKVARDVTQELMKGARWVGDQGMRAWKNYWQKPPDPGTVPKPPLETTRLPFLYDPLPPTHANSEESAQPFNQRAIVAILDLERLSASQSAKDEVAFHPLAAFALADGCSLVSFTPNGLNLLTASAKGDVQHVWSLMRLAHGGLVHQADLSPVHKAPSVRQIARFTRMTVARIVDVVWTEPGGERLALVTERGTVHIYDLPQSALQWPPPRRTIKAVTSAAQSLGASPEREPAVPANPSSGRLGSAMDMVTGRTQPLFAAVRGRPASIGNPFSGFSGMSLTAGAGIKSGKVVAAGFNRSVGAATGTVDTIRHLGENRLTLPGPSHAAAPGRVRWLAGKNRGYIAVTGGDTLRIHRISHSTNPKPGKRRPSVAGTKPVELRLGDTVHRPARGMQWKGTARREQPDKFPSSAPSFWQARAPRPVSRPEEDSLHSQAEIDTNAPYQPFHTDRRVNLHVYTEEDRVADAHHLRDSMPWVFGEGIPTMRTRAGAAVSNEREGTDVEPAGWMENHVRVQGNAKEGQQIVITTRRRKVAKVDAAEGGEEEIFEDDCEVVDFADERV